MTTSTTAATPVRTTAVWRAALAVLAIHGAGLAACGGDGDRGFQVNLSWRTQGSMPCPAATCASIQLLCDAMVGVRVVDAADPSKVYVDRCVPLEAASNLCGLGDLPLADPHEVPMTAVKVQVSIWPRDGVGSQCPTDVGYDLQGLPRLEGIHPAVGGESLVVLGSDDVDVALACPDIDALASDACLADRPISASASVDDFGHARSVNKATADYLILSAGQPVERIVDGTGEARAELEPTSLVQLVPDSTSRTSPRWSGGLPRDIGDTVCLEVLHRTEGGPTATCRSVPPEARSLDLDGSYLTPSLRKIVLGALGLETVPDGGLVLGRVVDRNGAPVPGIAVASTPPASVVYVSDDGARLDVGTAETSASGMFVSIDAAARTTWSVQDDVPSPAAPSAVGGRIAGHMTIVELMLGEPATQE